MYRLLVEYLHGELSFAANPSLVHVCHCACIVVNCPNSFVMKHESRKFFVVFSTWATEDSHPPRISSRWFGDFSLPVSPVGNAGLWDGKVLNLHCVVLNFDHTKGYPGEGPVSETTWSCISANIDSITTHPH